MTIRKQMNFVIKQVGAEADRTLRFIGSDENPDRDDDVITVAGWQTDDYMKNPVFLWAHDYSVPPLGKCINLNVDTKNKQLIFDIKFPTVAELSSDPANTSEHAKFVDTIYNLYKGGYLSATSVGFIGIKYKTRDDDSVLELPEWQRGTLYLEQSLLELSAVPVPANPNALQTAKSKGLVNDAQIKSFGEIAKKELGGEKMKIDAIKSMVNEAIKPYQEKISTLEIEKSALISQIKSGATLSSNTKTTLQGIHDKMADCMKDMQCCHKELADFITGGSDVGDDDGGGGGNPKSASNQQVKSVEEIDLSKFNIKDFNGKDKDDLDIDPEVLKAIIQETISKEFKNQVK